MSTDPQVMELRASPHLRLARDVPGMMREVALALVPVAGWAVWQFGLAALLLLATTTAACLATEALFARLSGRGGNLGDGSALVTGLLLGLTLPPAFPLWMAAVAGVAAIGLGKALFGGLGRNVFNPALVGRAFVQAAFPVAITTWTPPFLEGRFGSLPPSTLAFPFTTPAPVEPWLEEAAVDAWTGATPLALHKFQDTATGAWELMAGMTGGSAGEGMGLLIALAGLVLVARGVVDWRIPVAVLAGAAATAALAGALGAENAQGPWLTLFSGGLMLGAWFMATDPLGSPVTPLGVWIFGALVGMLTVVIRVWGGLPEGVMYAILLANAATPIIDRVTRPRPFGHRKGKA